MLLGIPAYTHYTDLRLAYLHEKGEGLVGQAGAECFQRAP